VMRVSGYITIGGHLFDLTQFIVLVSISLLVAIFLILMTYKRIGRSFRKAAPKK